MKETIKNIKRVYQYGKEYKKNLFGMFFAVASSTVINIILPLFIAKQIVCFTSSLWQQLLIISLVIFCIQAYISFAAMFFTRRNSQQFLRGTIRNLQIKLGKEILKIEQKDLDNNSSGMFTQRMVNDTEKMASFIGWDGLEHLRHIFANIGALFATLIINRQVFLYYLIVSIILTILYNAKTKQKGKIDIQFRNKTEKVSGLIGELVRGVRDIKMLNAQNSFMIKLEENITEQNEKRFEMGKINRTYIYIIDTLKALFELGLIILLIYLIKNNVITVAIAVALFNYKSGIMTLVMQHISSYLELAKNFNISCDRVFSILDNKDFVKEKFGNEHLEDINGNFEFKNVTFGYNENKKVLDNINFKIYSGEILIENININELDEDSIRGNMTIISQNPYIFNLSIRDNLKLVKEDLTDEEMYNACKIACLDKFIEGLPNKYDTIVGEAGVILSGGQKQRLAIARAFVQKTKIILFDEATSSLDNETQSEIQKAISNLKNEYTILIIAHRLSTIVNCNKIMIVEEGKISDSGTHEELINRNRTYQVLCQTEMMK